ncbi:MAG: LTA synthase family protein [Thiohalomonadales bacterium]
MIFLPRSIRYLGIIVLIHVTVFSLLRVLLWRYFDSPSDPLSGMDSAQALYIGFKYDLRVILLVLLPPLLLGLRGPLRLFSPWGKRVWLSYFVIVFYMIITLSALNFGYYAYLQQPLNATILRFFGNPMISLTMLWQSYHIVLIMLGLITVTAAYFWIIRIAYERLQDAPQKDYRRRGNIVLGSVIFVLVVGGLYGKWSYYPLRWSDAYFSPHPFVAAVSVNPVLHLYTTLKNRQVTYSKKEAQRYYPLMTDYLAIDQPDSEALSYVRHREGGALAHKRPNVILVLLESFASYKTNLSGNPLNATPVIADVAANAIYFRNFFVPHTGTARSVFTTITGLPDVEVTKTSSRNPLVVNQHSIMNDFVDYQRLYFIGGSASWGNIRGLLAHNIDGLQLYEENNYESPRNDVWGISDLDLFIEANKVLDRLSSSQKQPFFAIIQTSGNHRPYTIPDDKHGFVSSHLDKAQLIKHGFASLAEYNSFRFMDYSVGYFLQQAKQAGYFDNTLFVFYGDHGIHADTGAHIPKWEQQLSIQGLRVPLLFYGPKLIPRAQIIDTIASEMDVLPSIAGLVAKQYMNTTLGRNLFDDRYAQSRYAFTVTHGNGLTLGLLNQEFYYQMHETGSNRNLFQIRAGDKFVEDARKNVIKDFPEQAQKFATMTEALFETAKYMRYNNKAYKMTPVRNKVDATK